jgi:hypothetical protein
MGQFHKKRSTDYYSKLYYFHVDEVTNSNFLCLHVLSDEEYHKRPLNQLLFS